MRKKKLHREPAKNYFPLPNCIYQLGLSAGAIAVYGYLLYIENRETYQCHASYATMHVIAAHFKDDIGDLRALRGYAADEVKRTYGRISFDNAVKIQSSPED